MGYQERRPTQDYPGPQTDLARIANRYPHNLPASLSVLIGREIESRELISYCAHPDIRLITIYGLGGSGKTRLAIEIARSVLPLFEHGCWFIPIASLQRADLIPEAICSALNLPYSSRSDRKTQLLNYLSEKNILLILDNVEHLLPYANPIIQELIELTPSVKILTTSRESLHIQGEQLFRLSGLKVPQGIEIQPSSFFGAINLFAEQLGRLGYSLQEEDIPAAIKICQLVEGLPLALILAADWGRLMTCAEIAFELEQGQLLGGFTTTALPEKHNSLHTVFESSWRLLTEKEQAALRRLAVFASGFDRLAAARVAGATPGILANLHDHSMIERRAEKSFGIHELLRHFLLAKLAEAGEEMDTRDAHLNYFRELAETAEPHLYSHDQVAWLQKMDAQFNNLRAALHWGLTVAPLPENQSRTENAIRLAQALWYYWHVRWGWQEGRRIYAQCLSLPLQSLPPIVQVRAYAYAAIFESMAGDWDQAFAWVEHALSLARQHEVGEGIALALLRKGGVVRMKDSTQGKILIELALEEYRKLNLPFYICAALFYLGQESHGSSAEQAYYIECLELALKTGNKRYAAFILFNLGGLACFRGELFQASTYHQQSYTLMKEIGDIGGIFTACSLYGRTHIHLKDFDLAETLFQEGAQVAELSGDRNFLAEAYRNLGQLNLARGELQSAQEMYQKSLLLDQEFVPTGTSIHAQHGLGLVAMQENNYSTASWFLKQALTRFDSQNTAVELFDWIDILNSCAATFSAHNQASQAAILFSTVTSLLKQNGYVLLPNSQFLYNHWLSHARTRLDAPRFARAWQRGRSFDLGQAIEYLLETRPDANTEKSQNKTPPYPANLTGREVEVLHLVSQGLTDAQVAEQLVLSTRTVNAHLTSIYNKLGVNSRAAAVRFAVEQGLAD